MKKLISVLLAALMIFSVFSFSASADFELPPDAYTITFALADNNGDPIQPYLRTVVMYEGVELAPAAKLCEPDSYVGADGLTYYFVGWKDIDTGVVRTSDYLPKISRDATYTAVFEPEPDDGGGQTLLQFFRSIFERLNIIFEYFWSIFFRGEE